MGNRRMRSALTLLVWGVALGLAYGQSPLYTSNQNQYFLHGFAQAGVGQLSADWLAGTRDPTPLFSLLVRLMALTSPAVLNYLLYLLIFAVYLGALYGIARRLFAVDRSPARALLFFGIVFVTHSAALRYALGTLPGGEWGYLFDGGVGGQRLLGPVFQPSVFGALLLFSVWLYLEERPLAAMLLTVLAASVHPTYLLSAAALSAVYWLDHLRRSKRWRAPLVAAGITLLLVAPIVLYVYLNFFPPSAAAQEIMVQFRIPDHAIPAQWFDLTSVVKLGLIAAALILTRRSRLLAVMLTMLTVGTALTLLQILTGSNSLALLFPWRLSATLVPLATAVIGGWLAAALAPAEAGEQAAVPAAPDRPAPRVNWLRSRLARPQALRLASLTLVAASVLSGIGWSTVQFAQREATPEHGMFGFVRDHLAAGQQYLVPPKLQDFRLATGAPILADFKSIPYRGAEVLEWYQRVRLLQFFYRGRPADVDCGMLEVFSSEYGITHVVTEPDQHGLACDRLQPLYDDGAYSVYELVDDA